MVWKEFDGEKTTVNAMTSHDDGKSWSKPVAIATTTDTSDHPLLVSDGQKTFLSWMTKADGYRLLAIGDEVMKRAVACRDILVILLAPAPAAEASSQLKPFGRGSWQEILRAHAGRPTIVHFWGVTCGPCKVELPLLGQFMKEHGAIDVVTISADLVPNLPAAARAMLEKAGLGPRKTGFSTTASSSGCGSKSIRPGRARSRARILISRNGDTTTIEGSAEMADIEKWFDSNKTPQANEGDVRAGHRQTVARMIRGTWLRGKTCDGGWKSSFQSYCSRSWCS